jgi:signal transduction histidine kinase
MNAPTMPAPSPDVPWLDRLAHDLRGPLAPLQTASYLLQRDDLEPARRQELLAMVERQARRLGDMIDELNDWTRAAQQRLLGPREHCEPAMLLDHALVGSGLAATAIEEDGNVAVVDGDPRRLTQLLRILLEYASARGTVPIVTLRSGNGCIRIEVRVPGPAPDAAQLATLLLQPQAEPFDEGLGLRLLIARAIAHAHGGELEALVEDNRLRLRCELPLVDQPHAGT